MATSQRTHNDYTVGWICPLEVEQVAAIAMLDQPCHPGLPQSHTDPNSYTLGSIHNYNVVIAGLPITGNNSAATVAAHMRTTFPNIRYGLLVGIGGGVPTQTSAGVIRLGHVVVSRPTGEHSGAVQYDHGQAEAGHFRRTGSLAPPSNTLLAAADRMAANRRMARTDPLTGHLNRIDTTIRGLRQFRNPGPDNDHLYLADYVHVNRDLPCQLAGCDPQRRVDRPTEDEEDDQEWVTVHRGNIASGEKVMRNGLERDQLARQYNVLCFEMEAAGVLNDFPCLVIRGISDYSDSHKNDRWQGFAAAVAAAYARELISYLPIDADCHPKPFDGGVSVTNEHPTTELIDAVATAAAALFDAANSDITRRNIRVLIIKFEDAMLREMRSHPISSRWARDSYVKFYCRFHMETDPIPQNIWESMVRALEKSMERVRSINPDVTKEQLFGKFDVSLLRRIN